MASWSTVIIAICLLASTIPCYAKPQLTQGFSSSGNQCGPSDNNVCVPYIQCNVTGFVIKSGAELIDIKFAPIPQPTCFDDELPDAITVCCLLSSTPPPTAIHECPSSDEDCVIPNLCINGVISTGGDNVIMDRLVPTSECQIPGFPDVVAVCCLKPGLESKPDYITCSANDNCVDSSLCSGQSGIDLKSPFPSSRECLQVNGQSGICCPISKPDNICPQESTCVGYGTCDGFALTHQGNFEKYTPIGSWFQCTLRSGHTGTGQCCKEDIAPTQFPIPDKCGIRNYGIIRKIEATDENNEASFGEFPWQGLIFDIDDTGNFNYKCGCVLISNQHALSVAHCLDEVASVDDVMLRFGEWKVNTLDDPLPHEDLLVSEIIIHPDYVPKIVHNGIALLKLSTPVPIRFNINSVCLPGRFDVFADGETCFSSGWGQDTFEGEFQFSLKKVDLPYVNRLKCQNLLRSTRLGKYFNLHDSFTCAGGEGLKDTCLGDGGGPLVCKRTSSNQYLLAGITAWGIGCGTINVPGVYIDVRNFREWIDNIVFADQASNQQPLINYSE